jgi:tetratricopeptide (TPR) repeat protein
MLGVHAVRQGRYAEAVLFLREADAAAGGADAAIQNNLAVSLVRADPSQAGEAMELIEAALEQYPGIRICWQLAERFWRPQGLWAEAVESLVAALPAHGVMPNCSSYWKKLRWRCEISSGLLF